MEKKDEERCTLARTYYSSSEHSAWWTATFYWRGRDLGEWKEGARSTELSQSSAQVVCSEISRTWPVMRCRGWRVEAAGRCMSPPAAGQLLCHSHHGEPAALPILHGSLGRIS